jgi:choline dehydrogenase-like flavoprotein
MDTTFDPSARATLLQQAQDPQQTPFDYIVVGSGAGGGPLAARLALGGRRVLVLEAGTDPGKDAAGAERDIYAVPAFHGAATEDREMCWTFSVRHYATLAAQGLDTKYDAKRDPSASGGIGQGGIQYPRAAAIGGCTAHHAMIVIRPNDADWDWIAQRTNDPSWRSEHMQGYFPKIEKCLQYGVYNSFARRQLGHLLDLAQRIATLINPRRQLETGGHGSEGWQRTSFIDPLVIASIVRGDRTFLRVLIDVAVSSLAGKGERLKLLRALLRLQLLQFLDPNVRSPDFPSRAHLSLISVGTDGVRRHGLREYLLSVQKAHPQRLVIEPGTHVTRLVFEPGQPPRAIGVELLPGTHLYRASPMAAQPDRPPLQYFAKREVIVCGGAFNTPQLLMLSGIGDRATLRSLGIQGPPGRDGQPVAQVVDLPGVGLHLQDRYEVSVISEAKRDFSTLAGVTFNPGAPGDPALQQWKQDGSGLYSTNGGALAMMMSSLTNQAIRRDPDLFIFGFPAAFRGYYWNWSRELLKPTKGAAADQRNLWSWVILKAYTDNAHGRVTLRTADPLDPPQIDFNSFPAAAPGTPDDIAALAEAVERVRQINEKVSVFANEIQPGTAVPRGPSAQLDQWIRNEAWGHHACGTCRMGADPWRADPAKLVETDAVLSSDFRVHGVQGLRVVDTSVFPRIPGYFIVTPTFMIAEKAADTLLADRADYPRAIESREAAAVLQRRAIVAGGAGAGVAVALAGAFVPGMATPETDEALPLPDDTVGLALSGGGIRSATFCLGVLQALAARGRLRTVDLVSSVSGGGYAAAFLGRLYTRLADCVSDKPARVETILAGTTSPELWWLRRHANYIDSGSRSDLQSDIGVVLRNLTFVYLWLGVLLFGAFGLARWAADAGHELPWLQGLFAVPPWRPFGIGLSPWWWLPPAVLLLGVVPLAAGYWFVLKDPREGRRELLPLLLWAVLLACAVGGLGVPSLRSWAALGLGLLLLAWLAQEIAGWRTPAPDPDRARRGPAPNPGMPPSTPPSTVIRNRLSRALGSVLFGLALLLLWVPLDTLARATAIGALPWAGWSMLGVAPLLPLLRGLATRLMGEGHSGPASAADGAMRRLVLTGIAFGLVVLLLFYLDTLAHWVFRWPQAGPGLVATALLASLVVGRAFAYLNLSSLQQSYAQKLVRTFLGASNDARVHPPGADAPVPVNVPDPSDDVEFDAYQPHASGGPLHLIGACINDTVDRDSGRQLRGDKGLPMCVGPAGLSIGQRHHALWAPRNAATPAHAAPVKPVRVSPDPQQFHVLARRDGKPVQVERLKLGQWTAISGAAYTTGSGRDTSLVKSLLLGLLNIRIGYWWDSGIAAGQRPGRFPPGLWRRLKAIPSTLFRVQATLLDEWRAWFPGAAERLWYLSDGGHFDNTGLYELLRRRVPFIIAVDAGRDQDYSFDDLAVLTRQARIDFDTSFDWNGAALLSAGAVPAWITAWLDPAGIGPLSGLKRNSAQCAALARVSYADDPGKTSWLLLIKPCAGADLPTDVQNYAAAHPSFPQDSTFNQFFADDQWEAYRMLGIAAARSAIR